MTAPAGNEREVQAAQWRKLPGGGAVSGAAIPSPMARTTDTEAMRSSSEDEEREAEVERESGLSESWPHVHHPTDGSD